MPDLHDNESGPAEGDIMAGDRRIARADTALPDWYASDTAYRPIPIVWFAGALILQVLAQPLVAWLAWGLLGWPRAYVVALALVASGVIWQFTWTRGMQQAPRVWQVATAAMLLFFFTITAAAFYG